MKNQTISFYLGLTLTTAMSALPAKAAMFNFDEFKLIPVRPISSNHVLSFNGKPEDNQGQTPFLIPNPNGPGFGHQEISKNSPPNQYAPYYTVGRQSSPEQTGATRATSLNGGMGFTNFFSYLNTNGINLNSIGFGYGQKPGLDFTKTWNLGDDLLGQDWLASHDSTIEERIYRADPNAVESFLILDNIKFINFEYSPIYAAFDKGPTTSFLDDQDLSLTEAVKPEKFSGLDPLIDGLAEAFLLDVRLNGGKVQLISQDAAVADPVPVFDPNTGFVMINLRLPLTLSVVATQVPESSSVVGLFLVATLGALLTKRR